MKTKTRIILIVSLAMIILGSSLSALAWGLSGGNIGVNWVSGQGLTRPQVSGTISRNLREDSIDLDAFTDIDLDTDYGIVKLVAGDAYRVEYALLADLEEPEISVTNGLLTVRNTPVDQGGIGLLNFSSRWVKQMQQMGNSTYLTIYYPKDAELRRVTMDNDLGEFDLRELTVTDTLTLDAAMGSISLSQVKAGRISLDADMGEVICDGLTADSLDSSVAMGNLEVRDAVLAGADLDADMGAIYVAGDLSGQLEISCAMGSVEVRTLRPRSDFYMEAQTAMGQVSVDGNQTKEKTSGSSSAPNSLSVDCDMGSVDVYFQRG